MPQLELSGEVDGKSKVTPHAVLLNIKINNVDASFKRAGETVNPMALSAVNTPSGKAAAVKPVMESFTEEDEDEDDEDKDTDDEKEKEGWGAGAGATCSEGFDEEAPSSSKMASLFNSTDEEDNDASSGSGNFHKKKGRSSRLSATVVATSGIEPFEVADNVQPAEIIIICPLPTKDPLIEYRKMFDLMNALGGQKGVDIGGLK
jgi:hypothetical protein